MGKNTPVVSVVIPVYRSEDIVARAIGSLLAQGLEDWEAILVDDGSPDSSWRVVQAYSWIDPRIRVVRQTHAGACAARNKGIAGARGEYLLFLDADDWLEPDALDSLVQACDSARSDAVHGRFRYAMPDGTLTSWDGGHSEHVPLFLALGGSNVLSVPSVVLTRRSLLAQIGSFDTSLVHCGDWDLWGRVARHDGRIERVNHCVTGYRMRPGSLSRNPASLLRDAMTTIRRMHSPDPRVARPQGQFAHGADRTELSSRIAHFGAYAAGLAASSGEYEHVRAVLDLVPDWVGLSPVRTGEFIFYSLCFSNCCGPEGLLNFWPKVFEPVRRLIGDLETRSETPGLAAAIWDSMDACSERQLDRLPLAEPDISAKAAPAIKASYDTLAYDMLSILAMRSA